MSKKEQMHFNPEDSGLERSGHLFAKLGSLALLLEDNIQAEAELQTVKNGLDADLRTVKEKWYLDLKNAEKKVNSAKSAVGIIYNNLITDVTEAYFDGTATEEDVIYAGGLIHGPDSTTSWRFSNEDKLYFDSANKELELYKSLQIGEQVIFDGSYSNHKRIILSGELVEKPSFELESIHDGNYDPLNPVIKLIFTGGDAVSEKWYGLKNELVTGEDNINKYIDSWTKKNFVPKKSPVDPWKTFKVLDELAGIYNVGYSNQKVQTIKERLLKKVNKELFMDDYWTDDLPKKLKNIKVVGGQEKFVEVACLVGKKLSTNQLTDIFAEMLNSNLEKEPLTVQYATKLKAAEIAEKYCSKG
jgi:hypothetical protein